MATYFPGTPDPVAEDEAAVRAGMAAPHWRHWSKVESQQAGAEVDRIAREQEQRGVQH